MEEEKNEERKEQGEKQSPEQSEGREEEIKKETEPIPGMEQANKAVEMVQGITDKIGSLIGGIFGGSKQEKKK